MIKFNDEMKKKLHLFREKGLGCRRIAEELEVSRATALRWMKKCGLDQKLTEYKPFDNRIIKCLYCEKEKRTGMLKTKFCCESCRNKYNRKNKGIKQRCPQCNKLHRDYKLIQFCSKECRAEHFEKKRLIQRLVNYLTPKPEIFYKCKYCEKIFTLERKGKRFCSDYCRYRLDYEQRRKRLELFNIKCKECGKWFSSTNKIRIYCSTKCGKRYGYRKKEMQRRQRIKQNGDVDWSISIERLIKRDDSICYLCGDRVNIGDYSTLNDGTIITGESYPSIDHVVPVSKGGTHTWGNVKLAHRFCNSIKGNEIG